MIRCDNKRRRGRSKEEEEVRERDREKGIRIRRIWMMMRIERPRKDLLFLFVPLSLRASSLEFSGCVYLYRMCLHPRHIQTVGKTAVDRELQAWDIRSESSETVRSERSSASDSLHHGMRVKRGFCEMRWTHNSHYFHSLLLFLLLLLSSDLRSDMERITRLRFRRRGGGKVDVDVMIILVSSPSFFCCFSSTKQQQQHFLQHISFSLLRFLVPAKASANDHYSFQLLLLRVSLRQEHKYTLLSFADTHFRRPKSRENEENELQVATRTAIIIIMNPHLLFLLSHIH